MNDLVNTIVLENYDSEKTQNLAPRFRVAPHGSGGNGSTKHSPAKEKLRDNAVKQWFLTWNNYVPEDVKDFYEKVAPQIVKLRMQPEIGESGTSHYQGYIMFKTKQRLSALKKLNPKIHWEAVRNVNAAVEYCCKEETRAEGVIYEKGFPKTLKILSSDKLYMWQNTIIEQLLTEPDDRTINWVVDTEGNKGKTTFCKYLLGTFDKRVVVLTAGNASDVANALKNAKEGGSDLNDLMCVVFHYPRSAEHIAYKVIESCKDGLITNCKYESGTLVFNNPHVWVFANEAPEQSKFSKDRWKIWTIVDNKLVKYIEQDDKCEELLDRNIEKKTCCKVIFNE